MKQLTLILGFCMILCSSCDSKKEQYSSVDDNSDWLKKTQPEFDSQNQAIYYREYTRYDIKGNIKVPLDKTNPNYSNDFRCEFSFFNYGEDIRLFTGCADDRFIVGIGTINYAYLLEREDNIEIVTKGHNEKYGDWALVNLTFGNNYIGEVFMTPLAMKAYKEGDYDSFIFIQFCASNKYMNVLFYGNLSECFVVKNCSKYILPQSEISFDIDSPRNGPGRFWHVID